MCMINTARHFYLHRSLLGLTERKSWATSQILPRPVIISIQSPTSEYTSTNSIYSGTNNFIVSRADIMRLPYNSQPWNKRRTSTISSFVSMQQMAQ